MNWKSGKRWSERGGRGEESKVIASKVQSGKLQPFSAICLAGQRRGDQATDRLSSYVRVPQARWQAISSIARDECGSKVLTCSEGVKEAPQQYVYSLESTRQITKSQRGLLIPSNINICRLAVLKSGDFTNFRNK